MATAFLTPVSGLLSQLKCCVTAAGEILWPVKSFYQLAYPDSQRQYLGVVDKSRKALNALYCKVFGVRDADPMVVPQR